MYLRRLSELHPPRFEIGVFLLLDILPDKANELCLPGKERGGEKRGGKKKGRREERERGGRLLFQTFFRP